MTSEHPADAKAVPWRRGERRLAWILVLPAMAMLALAQLFQSPGPDGSHSTCTTSGCPGSDGPSSAWPTTWRPSAIAAFLTAAVHTVMFAAAAVTLEMAGGLALALAMDRLTRGVRVVRTAILLPWAVPTVVAALIWRFIFESPAGVASVLAERVAGVSPTWLADPVAAWIPIVIADVWKTTPFVALLLIAGLQNIDRSLYEAASLDGAGVWQQFRDVTLPLLKPALSVAFLFRLLDAFRVFDIVYVLTGGGPGGVHRTGCALHLCDAPEDLAIRYGSALSVMVFLVSFGIALLAVRVLTAERQESGA